MINPFDISPRLQPIVSEIIQACEKELTGLLRVPVLLDIKVKDRTLNTEYILEVVCDQFGTSPEALCKECRKRHLVTARFIYFYLCHKYCKNSWVEIGALLKRHRTTAMHGDALIKDLVDIQDSYVLHNLLPVVEILDNLKAPGPKGETGCGVQENLKLPLLIEETS